MKLYTHYSILMVGVIGLEPIWINSEGFLVLEVRLELTSLVFSLMPFQQDLLVKVYTIHFTNDYLNDSNKSLASADFAIFRYLREVNLLKLNSSENIIYRTKNNVALPTELHPA